MAREIEATDSGAPILNADGTVVGAFDPAAPNIAFTASVRVTYDPEASGAQAIEITFDEIPDPGVADYVTVSFSGTADNDTVTGVATGTISEGTISLKGRINIPAGAQTVTLKAHIMPHKTESGPLGAAGGDGNAQVEQPTVPTPVQIVSVPAFSEAPQIGSNVRVTPTQITGEGTAEPFAFRQAEDANGFNASDVAYTAAGAGYNIPSMVEGRYLKYVERVTGTGLSQPVYPETAWTQIAAAQAVLPLVPGEDFTLASAYRGRGQSQYFVALIHPMNSRMEDAYGVTGRIDWSSQITPTDQTTEEYGVHPTGVMGDHGYQIFEAIMSPTRPDSLGGGYYAKGTDWDWDGDRYAVLIGAAATAAGSVQLALNQYPAVGSSFGSDFSRVDKLGPYASSTKIRLRIQDTVGGPLSGWSDQVAFTAPVTVPPPSNGEVMYFNNCRHPGEKAANLIAGDGRQFERCFRTSKGMPSRIVASQDVTLPIMSDDFGINWYTPDCIGLIGGDRGHTIWMDPDDGNRIVVVASAYGRRAFGSMIDMSGIYLSTDGLHSVSRRQILQDVLSTNQPQRWPHYTMTHIPGGTPSTRRLYFAYNTSDNKNDTAATTGALWTSADGGSTWSKVRDLAGGTFGERYYQISGASGGGLYLACDAGLFYTANPLTTNFSRVTSTPANQCPSVITVDGDSRVWAVIKSNGLYRAASAGGSFTRISTVVDSFSPRQLAVSPADRNYMSLNHNSRMAWSHDGGSTWTKVAHTAQPSGGDPWSANMTSEWCLGCWNETNRNTVVFMANQHFQRSTDGGVKSYPSNNGFGFKDVYDRAFHHSDPLYAIDVSQDVGASETVDGYLSMKHDEMTSTEYQGFIGGTPGTGYPFNCQGVVLHPVYKGTAFIATGTTNKQVMGFYLSTGPNLDQGLKDYVLRADLTNTAANCFGATDPNDPYYSYLGRYRIHWKLTSGGAGVYPGTGTGKEAQVYDELFRMTYDFFSMCRDQGNVIYGGSAGDGQSGLIYRSTNRGSSWSQFISTNATYFRPLDMGQSVWASLSENDTIYMCGRDGLRRVRGVGAQTVTKILDVRDFQGPNKKAFAPSWAPSLIGEYGIKCLAQDPLNPDVAYANTVCYGGVTVLMTTNFTDNAPDWTDITADENGHGGFPKMNGRIRCHPLTGDLIYSSLHGDFIRRGVGDGPHTGLWYDQNAAYMAGAS